MRQLPLRAPRITAEGGRYSERYYRNVFVTCTNINTDDKRQNNNTTTNTLAVYILKSDFLTAKIRIIVVRVNMSPQEHSSPVVGMKVMSG